jgi:ABC-2 type transport system ATP-binding protein
MLQVKKINKQFGDKTALNEVSFELKDKSVIGLLGPNGAGKTTLMRIVVGFLLADEGEILIGKRNVETQAMDYKKKIGYLPEGNPLYGYMMVDEYLKYVALLKDVANPHEEIKQVATECGLSDVLKSKIETLSKGYKQRVGLAAALIGDPELLILDEPTTGLDPNQIVEIRKLIKKMAKSKTVILSTHILPEAKAICDRLLIINRGQIVLDETTDKIKNLEKKFIQLTS